MRVVKRMMLSAAADSARVVRHVGFKKCRLLVATSPCPFLRPRRAATLQLRRVDCTIDGVQHCRVLELRDGLVDRYEELSIP